MKKDKTISKCLCRNYFAISSNHLSANLFLSILKVFFAQRKYVSLSQVQNMNCYYFNFKHDPALDILLTVMFGKSLIQFVLSINSRKSFIPLKRKVYKIIFKSFCSVRFHTSISFFSYPAFLNSRPLLILALYSTFSSHFLWVWFPHSP